MTKRVQYASVSNIPGIVFSTYTGENFVFYIGIPSMMWYIII